MRSRPTSLLLCLALFALGCIAAAQTPSSASRLLAPIDGSRFATLAGNVHPKALREFDRGPVDPDFRLPSVTLMLKPSSQQQAALAKLLADQQRRSSRNYHRWLTPEQFADRFGASRDDLEKITAWLQSQGFTIVQRARGRNWITFSGTASQVRDAFHTEIHRYAMDGETHFANASAPSVPLALRDWTIGLRGLNDFRLRPLLVGSIGKASSLPSKATPDMTQVVTNPDGTQVLEHLLAPDDLATIYDVTPLYQAGTDGTGQKLVVVGQSDITLSDIQQFRAGFNLPANDPQIVLVPGSPDPGHTSDEAEADLDLEWAGAVARKASILYVNSDVSAGGAFNAAQYAIDNHLAPVISMSYGSCEQNNAGTPIAGFEAELQKANAEGITFVAASGDFGPAACDAASPAPVVIATQGLAVNYPASSPEATSVGGSTLNDAKGVFWVLSNSAGGGSAVSYIPEVTWNDTAALTVLSASGGGASSCVGSSGSTCTGGFAKPAWQNAIGVPADNVRDVPDIAFAASAFHNGYVVCSLGSCAQGIPGLTVGGGTSVGTPVFAAMASLLNQYVVSQNIQAAPGLGNMNPNLYQMSQQSYGSFVFHDITSGNNFVPCSAGSPTCPPLLPFQIGYSAGLGYDQVTGLGSLDANSLFTAWGWFTGGNKSATLTTVSASTLKGTVQQVVPGTQVIFTVNVTTVNGAPTGTVTVLSGSTPLGSTDITVGNTIVVTPPTGAQSVTAVYSGDSTFAGSTSAPIGLFVADFTVSSGVPSFNVQLGQSASVPLTITPSFSDFTPTVTLGCYGLPAEATCKFTPATVALAGGPATATLVVSTTAPTGRLHPILQRRSPLYALLLSGWFGVAIVVSGRRFPMRRQTCAALLGLLLLVTLSLAACSGKGLPPDPGTTPTGTIPFSVTATTAGSNPIFHSMTLTMNLQ